LNKRQTGGQKDVNESTAISPGKDTSLSGSPVIAVVLVLSACLAGCKSQTPLTEAEARRHLQEQFKVYAEAWREKEFEKAVSLLHPAIVEEAGGEDIAVEHVRLVLKHIQETAGGMERITFDSAGLMAFEGSDCICVIKLRYPTEAFDGVVLRSAVATIALVCVSQDGGRNWTFSDGTGNSVVLLSKLHPVLWKKIEREW
jgi:hypothetical protein